MIPPGECLYAGRKRRKPIQKQRPAVGAEKSNPSKRHRDRLNAELDHLASLLPLPPDIIAKLDKLSVLRLSVSYLRVKSFFQALQERRARQPAAGAPSPGDRGPHGGSGGSAVLEGRLLLESLHGFALVVSAEGMIFYASATIVDYLGFHQTDVMHQNIYDYIHVDDRQDFCRQLHWAMDPPQVGCGQPLLSETGEDAVLGRLLRAQEGGSGSPTEYSAFLTRCFVCRVRCLLDSTSGFLTMQFQGKLKFLFGQKRRAPSGAALPPRLSLFCVAVPVFLPPAAEMQMKSMFLRAKHRVDVLATPDTKAKTAAGLCESELHGKSSYLAGRSSGENGLSMFRAPADACRWGRVAARAPCLCLRGGPDLLLDPEWAAEDGGAEELGGVSRSPTCLRELRDLPPYGCRLETPGPTKHLNWTTGRHGQDDSAKPKPEPGKGDPFPTGPARGTYLPYPGAQGTVHAVRSSPGSHPPKPPPGACVGRSSRAWRDGHQGQAPPPTSCPFPQGSLEDGVPRPGGQRLPAGRYPTEDKLRGVPMPPGAPCNPVASLDVPVKMESDSGSEDAADGYSVSPSQLWLGASDMAKRQLVTFPTRMHLKTEPGSRHPLYSPALGPGLLGAHPRPGRELAPGPPAHCACLEPPPRLCARGHQPPSLGCDCRAPGPTPVVKLEPLDSPPWAAHSQGGAPGMIPRSALATRMPPRDPEGTFLL
ncbi:aryl hydrocarbon receptor repressor [Hippopotamus amphibius kiboko]|uniref:aryl hydrocarbon receptor repressor n=1 Tax=Hippopotamus amphibius kiboko TaxID=575201 RepID=UPI002591BFF6|nr:aryl hydrocarbon receptor repressor [Hippopotamus amphibius kiboko]